MNRTRATVLAVAAPLLWPVDAAVPPPWLSRCFCPGTHQAVTSTLASLRSLPWPEGKATAAAWEKDIASGALRWGCVEDTADFTR